MGSKQKIGQFIGTQCVSHLISLDEESTTESTTADEGMEQEEQEDEEDEDNNDNQRTNRDDWNRFREYRRLHCGPLSTKAFTFWRKNGEKDVQGFIWKAKKTPSRKEAL